MPAEKLLELSEPTIPEEHYLYRLFREVSARLKEKHNIKDESVVSEGKFLRDVYSKTRPWQTDKFFEGIDFDDVERCCGYLERYAGCHSALARNVCCELVKYSTELEALLQRTELSIVSIGGGPGNDLLGFAEVIYSNSLSLDNMKLTIIDRCSGWRKVFKFVAVIGNLGYYGNLSHLLRNPFVHLCFIHDDLSSKSDVDPLKGADIILMTKVLSNIPSERKRPILKHVFGNMSVGAVFVYIDIDADIVLEVSSGLTMKVLWSFGRRQFRALPGKIDGGNVFSTYEVIAVQKCELCTTSHQGSESVSKIFTDL